MLKRCFWFNAVIVFFFVFFSDGCGNQPERATLRGEESQKAFTPAVEVVNPERLKIFRDLCREFQDRASEEQKAYRQQEAEIAHLKLFWAFQQLRCAYSGLNESERQAIFESEKNLPKGMIIGPGGPVVLSLTSGEKQNDFEDFLSHSFMEVDYMSAFQISWEEQEKIHLTYRESLRKRGLLVCEI